MDIPEFSTTGSIVYHDDKKEKWQSHEARFKLGDSLVDEAFNDLSFLSFVGYGANPEQAKAELLEKMKTVIEYSKRLTSALEIAVTKLEQQS